VPQLGVGGDEQALRDTNGNLEPLVTIVTDNGGPFRSFRFEASSDSGCPARRSAAVRASSTAAMASCWFAVGETCQPSSYLDQ
jgi:hypothetical protein